MDQSRAQPGGLVRGMAVDMFRARPGLVRVASRPFGQPRVVPLDGAATFILNNPRANQPDIRDLLGLGDRLLIDTLHSAWLHRLELANPKPFERTPKASVDHRPAQGKQGEG